MQDFPRTTLKAGVGLYAAAAPVPGGGRALRHAEPQVEPRHPVLARRRAGAHPAARRLAEGFYKQLDSQVIGTASPSGTRLAYTNDGTGYVVGGELLVKYKPDEHFFGWLAYTLSRSVRSDGPGMPEYLFQYDQPHILTVLGSYNLGHGWEFGARFRLISGNLVTPERLRPDLARLQPRTAPTPSSTPRSGTYTAIPISGPSSERLPLFHQLDIRVDKHVEVQELEALDVPRRAERLQPRSTSRASRTTSTTPGASTWRACPSCPASASGASSERMKPNAPPRRSSRSLALAAFVGPGVSAGCTARASPHQPGQRAPRARVRGRQALRAPRRRRDVHR